MEKAMSGSDRSTSRIGSGYLSKRKPLLTFGRFRRKTTGSTKTDAATTSGAWRST
jgi:hypothetical protein